MYAGDSSESRARWHFVDLLFTLLDRIIAWTNSFLDDECFQH